MKFDWDEQKNSANLTKHGISFEEASGIFDGVVFTAVDTRRDYGEERRISIGEVGEAVVIVVVHTDRDSRTRIISARKANRKERGQYYEYLEKAIKGDSEDR